MKQRYIKVNHELIPVTEEVYQAYTRAKESERYRARRDGRCGQSNYHLCSGDCASCPWQQEGYRVISLHKALGPELEHETPELNTTASSLDDVVADRLLLEQLYRQLDLHQGLYSEYESGDRLSHWLQLLLRQKQCPPVPHDR